MDNRLTHTTPIKQAGTGIFLVVVFFLMLFPFINTLNEFLVRVVEPFIFFKPIQDVIIPYEVRVVRVILGILGVPMTDGDPWAQSITLLKNGGQEPIVMVWNCLGWQSLLVVAGTLVTGLTGKFTLFSKLEVLIIGLLGTFLVNIGRIAGIFFLFYHFDRRFALIFHDYGSVILTIGWLMFLWWYAFRFVLRTKKR